MLDKTKNYKIDVTQLSTVERCKLQEELFKLGYRWGDGEGSNVKNLDEEFLFLNNDKCLCYGDFKCYIDMKFIVLDANDIVMTQPEPTLTLRDHFAGQALASLITNPDTQGTYENFANIAYAYADAMLKERNK